MLSELYILGSKCQSYNFPVAVGIKKRFHDRSSSSGHDSSGSDGASSNTLVVVAVHSSLNINVQVCSSSCLMVHLLPYT